MPYRRNRRVVVGHNMHFVFRKTRCRTPVGGQRRGRAWSVVPGGAPPARAQPATQKEGEQKGNRFLPSNNRHLMNEQMALVLEHVRTVLQGSGSHGFDHTARVVRLCEVIGASEGADMAVLIPAALFHDIARPLEEETGVPHEEEGARMAETLLRSIHYPEDHIPGIIHAIRAHRYSVGIAPETLEARVLVDADNLDAMGAVGIARTFLQAGERGGGILDAIDHIREKLLNLKSRMYTESARSIAEERHAFLTTFLETLDGEMHPCTSSPETGPDRSAR